MTDLIYPLWLDGPLKGSDHTVDLPTLSSTYTASWPVEVFASDGIPLENGPNWPLHYYHFHKFAFLGHLFVVASEYSDLADVEYISMHRDTLFDLFVSDRAKKAEREQ